MNRQRGIALPLVMWTLMLLSLIAASLSGDSREALRTARNAAASARAEALADGGVYRAVQALLEPRPEERWRADARPYDLTLPEGRLRIRIQDAAGLVDLNTGAEELLSGVLVQAGMEPAQARALTEAVSTRRAEIGPFEDVGEIREAAAIPPPVFRRLERLLTVHTGQLGVDPLTAPREVLLALPGIEPAAVDALMAAREGDEAAMMEVGGEWAATSPRRVFVVMTEAVAEGATYRRLAVLRILRQMDRPFVIHAWRLWQP